MAVLHALASPAALASAPPQLLDPVGAAAAAPHADLNSKARSAAVDFEAQFLNSMFSQMLAGIQSDGPFGGGQAVGVWRSFLSEQYAKSFAKAGGIGIADHVYHALLAQQEAHAR